MLIDGVPANDLSAAAIGWNLIPLEDIQHIEILRAVVSALYSSNVMGGVVNIFTGKSSEETPAMFALSYGNKNTKDGSDLISDSANKWGLSVLGWHT